MSDTGRVLVGAIDQGTTSSRFLVFDVNSGELVTYSQEPVKSLYPHRGWVEQDARHLYGTVLSCINRAAEHLIELGISPTCIKCIGIANQRETTIAWDQITGEPLYNAIVWLDNRTKSLAEKFTQRARGKSEFAFQRVCGLPINAYFSALKMRWLLDECDLVRTAAHNHTLMMGTVDSWLLWKLSQRRVFATDVTNASRSMLMNLHRTQWDKEMCRFFRLNPSVLPEIHSSSEFFAIVEDPSCRILGVPITAIMGDQQAALFGQDCTRPGDAKNTYGTGCFLLCNTGTEPVFSDHGLLTTVAYQLGGMNQPVYYALEGSVANAGSTLQFLRDNLGLLSKDEENDETQDCAKLDKDAAGNRSGSGEEPYLVPAFTGLFCPHWDPGARTCFVGIDFSTTKLHIIRAALEATCFQTREVLEAIERDFSDWQRSKGNLAASSSSQRLVVGELVSYPDEFNSASTEQLGDRRGRLLTALRIDGGMTKNDYFVQLQSNLSGLTVQRPTLHESTALGVAIAAALGANMDVRKLRERSIQSFQPQLDPKLRDERFVWWKRAVLRSLNWQCSEETVQQEIALFRRRKQLVDVLESTRCTLTAYTLRDAVSLSSVCGMLLFLGVGVALGMLWPRYRH